MAGYRIVTLRIKSVLEASLWVTIKGRQGEHNILRSLLHGGDDLRLPRMPRDVDVTLRVVDWKAEQLGLAG
jgi:hypothetical protein